MHLLITKRSFPKICRVTLCDPEVVAEASVREESFDLVQHVTKDETQLGLKTKMWDMFPTNCFKLSFVIRSNGATALHNLYTKNAHGDKGDYDVIYG